MGNYHVGDAMDAAARVFWKLASKRRKNIRELALSVLDEAAESWIGADAEFEDYTDPGQPLGRMIALAFDATPGEMSLNHPEDPFASPWHDGPLSRFFTRYKFC
ncbi:MAG: hypothetical protein GC191_09070 [Azospirillum sp.]|nr:hypothetical protein [Azospirillum sp.]